MKKFNILITFVALALTVISCETYDDYEEDRKDIVAFFDDTRNINGAPSGSFKSIEVEVFITEIANVDRQFNVISIPAILDPASDPPQIATNPENYTFDSTVTIPANSRIGVMTVSGTNVSLSEEDEYFSLRVEGSENVISGKPITIRLRD